MARGCGARPGVHVRQRPGRPSAPGTRYLQEQRIRSQADRALARSVEARCGRIRERLADLAADFVERRLLPVDVERDPGRMVANWALLVPRDRVAALRERTRELDEQYQSAGLRLRVAGAWPPYSFTPALQSPGEPALEPLVP